MHVTDGPTVPGQAWEPKKSVILDWKTEFIPIVRQLERLKAAGGEGVEEVRKLLASLPKGAVSTPKSVTSPRHELPPQEETKPAAPAAKPASKGRRDH